MELTCTLTLDEYEEIKKQEKQLQTAKANVDKLAANLEELVEASRELIIALSTLKLSTMATSRVNPAYLKVSKVTAKYYKEQKNDKRRA